MSVTFKFYCRPYGAKLANKQTCQARRAWAQKGAIRRARNIETPGESVVVHCGACPGPEPILPPEAA